MLEARSNGLVARLCRLSGEDAEIIYDPRVDTRVSGKFAAIGLLVLVIFFLSVYSSVHFLVNLLNGNHAVAVVIGLFWGVMIANIYYLLLFTITLPILKGREHSHRGVSKEVTTEKKGLARISLSFRLLFVVLIAMVVAQPWLVTLFDTSQWIAQERWQYRREFMRLAGEVVPTGDSLGMDDRRAKDRQEIDRLLAANNFYTRKIQLINRRYLAARLVTFIVVSFFILPIVLKYRIRSRSNFYTVKKEVEEHFVISEYDAFKGRYTGVFTNRLGILVEWYESCLDPPFNTRKKEEAEQHIEQQLLLNEIYPEGEESEKNKVIVHETM